MPGCLVAGSQYGLAQTGEGCADPVWSLVRDQHDKVVSLRLVFSKESLGCHTVGYLRLHSVCVLLQGHDVFLRLDAVEGNWPVCDSLL